MNPSTLHITLYDLAFLGMIFVGSTFTLQLWFTKRSSRGANRFLSLALATVVMWIAWLLGIDIRLEAYFPLWSWMPLQFSLAPGPLIYFYLLKITQPEYKLRWKGLLHFSPLLLQQGLLVFEIRESIRTGAATYNTFTYQQINPVLYLAAFISVIVYLYWSFRLVERFYQQLKFDNENDRYRSELRWLHRSLVGFGLLWLFWVPFTAVDYFYYHNRLGAHAYYPLYLLLALMMIRLAAATFLKPEIALPVHAHPVSKPLRPIALKQKGVWLKKAMEENLFYQDAELSLHSLAERLKLNPNELSRIINQGLKKSFNDFINEYRIREVIRKMQNPAYDRITLIGIAIDAGYNSKSTFNRTFRQMTGKSPAEYKGWLEKERPSYTLGLNSRSTAIFSFQETTSKWSSEKLNRNYMIKNYLKIAWRNLLRNKVFSFINIAGLAVGMAACIIIMLFVTYEKSFDNFHTRNIYRLNELQKFPGMEAAKKSAFTMLPMGPALKKEFPGISNFTRVTGETKYPISYSDKQLFLPRILTADPAFLQLFNFKLLKGDRRTALQKSHCILLTEETAKKLFGGLDPVGKTVTHYAGDTTSFSVTGIIENSPRNSHLQFDAIYSASTMYQPWMSGWGRGDWISTYVELVPGTNTADLEKKFPAFMERHMPGVKDGYKLFLQKLTDIHGNSTDIESDSLNFQKFDKKTTQLFALIAFLVLLIACVNFINLSTSRSAEKAKEVGIRKAIGARRMQLSVQFLIETLLLSFLALLFALVIAGVSLPYINNIIHKDLSGPLFNTPAFIICIILFTGAVGLLSGIYPSLFLSAFKPIKVLKGSVETGKNKGNFRNVLVVVQFSSAVFLMIATVIVFKQLSFMQSRDPGFSRDQVVTIPLNDVTAQKYQVFKQELLNSSLIKGVTASRSVLGNRLDMSGIAFKPANGPRRYMPAGHLIADEDYLTLYKLKLIEGKNFSTEKTAAGREYVVNETLAKNLLGGKPGATTASLIGSSFGFDTLGRITGIVKDFNFNSLHYKIEGMFIVNSNWPFTTVSVKISGSKTAETLSLISSVWKKIFPGQPYEYQFLDDHFKEVYNTDTQVSQIVGILAGLAIFISCLGLFGLATYAAERRVKEIGIRKVLGASVQRIVLLLSGDFIKLVLIANVIAWPLAWYATHKWLTEFAYRINVDWGIFATITFVSILIAVLTIGFQSIKAAIANPVTSLKNE